MNYKMKENTEVRVAISGKSGCGNTTVSSMLAEKLGIKLINYTFRQLAAEKGLTLAEVIENAKTRRVSVCNALDCLVIHKDRLGDLVEICSGLIKEKNVVIEADEASYNALNGNYPAELLTTANEESFGKEFMSHRMSIKTVDSLRGAIEHINNYTSKHSESIVTENEVTGSNLTQRRTIH